MIRSKRNFFIIIHLESFWRSIELKQIILSFYLTFLPTKDILCCYHFGNHNVELSCLKFSVSSFLERTRIVKIWAQMLCERKTEVRKGKIYIYVFYCLMRLVRKGLSLEDFQLVLRSNYGPYSKICLSFW